MPAAASQHVKEDGTLEQDLCFIIRVTTHGVCLYQVCFVHVVTSTHAMMHHLEHDQEEGSDIALHSCKLRCLPLKGPPPPGLPSAYLYEVSPVVLPHVLCVIKDQHQGLISQQHIQVLHTRTRTVSLWCSVNTAAGCVGGPLCPPSA